MMEIKSRIDGRVLFEGEFGSIRLAVEAAVGARANLYGANLSGAYLYGANLYGAHLSGAKWRDGIVIGRLPLFVMGLRWPVTILDAHMQIGCKLHRLCEWAGVDDSQIYAMDGRDALAFWRAHRGALLGLARADGRDFSAGATEGAEKVERI